MKQLHSSTEKQMVAVLSVQPMRGGNAVVNITSMLTLKKRKGLFFFCSFAWILVVLFWWCSRVYIYGCVMVR